MFSFIKIGSTRISFLVGKVVFKIVRIRPIYGFSKACEARRNNTLQGKSFLRFLLGTALWGFVVNRNEFLHYTKYKGAKLIPTSKMFLWGIVISQLRSQIEITDDEMKEIANHNPKGLLESSDLWEVKQYGRHPHTGKIVILDYGDPRSISVLEKITIE